MKSSASRSTSDPGKLDSSGQVLEILPVVQVRSTCKLFGDAYAA